MIEYQFSNEKSMSKVNTRVLCTHNNFEEPQKYVHKCK